MVMATYSRWYNKHRWTWMRCDTTTWWSMSETGSQWRDINVSLIILFGWMFVVQNSACPTPDPLRCSAASPYRKQCNCCMLSKDKPRKRVTSTFNVSVYIATYLALELWRCRHTTVNAAIVNESATILYTIQLEFVLLWPGLEQVVQ